MFLFVTPSLPTISLPSRERLQRVWSASITALLWAIAITYTAGKLTRRGWEAIRPGLARALHALALLLDGGLAYPDQPEPDPEPDPQIEFLQAVGAIGIRESRTTCSNQLTSSSAPAATKPRAARRRTTAKAAVKTAA